MSAARAGGFTLQCIAIGRHRLPRRVAMVGREVGTHLHAVKQIRTSSSLPPKWLDSSVSGVPDRMDRTQPPPSVVLARPRPWISSNNSVRQFNESGERRTACHRHPAPLGMPPPRSSPPVLRPVLLLVGIQICEISATEAGTNMLTAILGLPFW